MAAILEFCKCKQLCAIFDVNILGEALSAVLFTSENGTETMHWKCVLGTNPQLKVNLGVKEGQEKGIESGFQNTRPLFLHDFKSTKPKNLFCVIMHDFLDRLL